MKINLNAKGQAIPGATIPLGEKNFEKISQTEIYWLGNASIFINSRGTKIMVDPLLEGFDMDLLIEMPIFPEKIPELDAIINWKIIADFILKLWTEKFGCREIQNFWKNN